MALLFQRDSLLTRMGDTSDLDQQIEQLRKCEVIKESDVKILCAKAREILGRDGMKYNDTGFHTFLTMQIPFQLRRATCRGWTLQ